MPIEFSCPKCSSVLRTPDASAGKKARCPQCSTIADVPTSQIGSQDAAPDPAPGALDGNVRSGISEQISKSPFGDEVTSQPTTSPLDSNNPYAAPSLREPALKKAPLPADDSDRIGLPWERGEKSVTTFRETTRLILGSPTVAFQMVKRDGGMLSPMLFALAGGFVGAMFSAVYGVLMQLGMLGFMAAMVGEGPEMAAGAGMVAVQVVFQFGMALFAGTVGVIIGLFITSAIYHLFLMMVRGANYPFEATFVVVAYVTGATALAQIVPICGQHIYLIMSLAYAIIGLSAVQQISGGKAAAAVLLPLLICITLSVLVVVGIIALIVGASGQF